MSTPDTRARLVGPVRSGRATPAPVRCAPTTCSASATPPRRWPARPCAARWAPRSTSAPAAASRRCELGDARPAGDRHRPVRSGAALRRHHRRPQRPDVGAARRRPGRAGRPGAGSTWWSATRRSSSARARPATPTATRAGPATRSAPSWRRRAAPAHRGRHDAVPGELGARLRRGLAGRVAGWVAGTGCDAWIVQREVSDPVEYVNLWLRDASEGGGIGERRFTDTDRPGRRPGSTGSTPEDRGVGFGVVTLRRSGRADPVVRAEDLRQASSRRWGRRSPPGSTGRTGSPGTHDLLRGPDRAPGLRLTQEADHDGDDWAVDARCSL